MAICLAPRHNIPQVLFPHESHLFHAGLMDLGSVEPSAAHVIPICLAMKDCVDVHAAMSVLTSAVAATQTFTAISAQTARTPAAISTRTARTAAAAITAAAIATGSWSAIAIAVAAGTWSR